MLDSDINPIAKKLQGKNLEKVGKGNVRRRVPIYKKKWFSILIISTLVGGVVFFGVAMAFITPLREQAEAFNMDDLHKIEKASLIFDRSGDEFGRIYMLNRTPIEIEQVPSHLIQALTAEEDSRYFQHSGVDMMGVFRAIWLNYKAGEETQGASTITQQLARDAFKLKEMETDEKNSRYTRKIVEWFAAERVETKYTKSEILELYLNRIYFGGGFYGIQAASQGYFSKDVKDLTLEESATLCGLIKSPNNLQPVRHPDRAKKARNHVYSRMYTEGFLTEDDMLKLAAKPVVTKPRSGTTHQSYVYEAIRQQAMQIVGSEEALLGGFNIYSTVDANLQKAAEKAVRERLAQTEQHQGYAHQTYAQYQAVLQNHKQMQTDKTLSDTAPKPQAEYLQAAVLAIDNHDGGILAMVGGRDFRDSEFNRAVQSRRPAGSAFLPFVYAAAFQKPEFYPPMQLEDGPIDNRRVMIGGLTGILGEWGTEQDVTKFAPQITAREALSQSRNAATVRLGERVGLAPVKELAAKAGIASPLRDYPSTFLGASEVKLDEMCLAYSAFANKGVRAKELTLIHRITDYTGKVIYQVKEEDIAADQRVMDEVTAYQTHTCLVDALNRGTGKLAAKEYGLEKFPAAGKTGTHYEFKDLWFLGYTSAVTCGVWCGFDQQKPIYLGAYSNKVALPIWTDVMNVVSKQYKAEQISPPLDAQMVETCRKSGKRATDACYEKFTDPGTGAVKAVRDTFLEALRPGSIFDTFCDVHTGGGMDGPALAVVAPQTEDGLPTSLAPSTPLVANVEPVRMQGMTVIGIDPYNTIIPIPKAEAVQDDGTRVLRAVPVEEETPATQAPIKLEPPPPLQLE